MPYQARQLAVVHVELEERVARGQGHLVGLARVPAAHDQAAAVRVLLDHRHEVADLVERAHYPGLPPVRGLSLSETLGDSLRFFGVVLAANLVALIVYTLLFSLTVNAMQSRHRASTDFAFLLLAVHGLQSLRSKPARMHRPATCEVGA